MKTYGNGGKAPHVLNVGSGVGISNQLLDPAVLTPLQGKKPKYA